MQRRKPAFPAAALVALCLALSSVPAAAQPGRGHQDLRRMPLPERVETIEREYARQARGRAIPDDQLEFYLDRVAAGWTFDQVRQDIAASLRGSHSGRPGAGWGGWNGSSWTGQTLICSSTDHRRRECRTPFRGRPVLVENISRTRCVEGVNFGGGGGTMWVDRGCRGRFAEGRGRPHAGSGGIVRCESRDRRHQLCPAGFRGRAVLVKQLSDTACVEGRNWGQRGGDIWVDAGCRGEFALAGAVAGHTITCSSDGKRFRACNWDRRWGRPVLVEQLSSTRCQEGHNWGWKEREGLVWVDGGCRARFAGR